MIDIRELNKYGSASAPHLKDILIEHDPLSFGGHNNDSRLTGQQTNQQLKGNNTPSFVVENTGEMTDMSMQLQP